jgi:hypothetical protein
LGFAGTASTLDADQVTGTQARIGKVSDAMEASTSDAGGGAAPVRRRAGMARWLGGSGGRSDGRGDAFVDELEAEVALLREENARLRMRDEHGGGDRSWQVRMGVLDAEVTDAVSRADDASELLTECRILRAALLDACGDVERSMREVRRRLEELEPSDATVALAPEPRASAER